LEEEKERAWVSLPGMSGTSWVDLMVRMSDALMAPESDCQLHKSVLRLVTQTVPMWDFHSAPESDCQVSTTAILLKWVLVRDFSSAAQVLSDLTS